MVEVEEGRTRFHLYCNYKSLVRRNVSLRFKQYACMTIANRNQSINPMNAFEEAP